MDGTFIEHISNQLHFKWETETYSVPEKQSHNSTQELQDQTDCQCVEELQWKTRWCEQKSIIYILEQEMLQ